MSILSLALTQLATVLTAVPTNDSPANDLQAIPDTIPEFCPETGNLCFNLSKLNELIYDENPKISIVTTTCTFTSIPTSVITEIYEKIRNDLNLASNQPLDTLKSEVRNGFAEFSMIISRNPILFLSFVNQFNDALASKSIENEDFFDPNFNYLGSTIEDRIRYFKAIESHYRNIANEIIHKEEFSDVYDEIQSAYNACESFSFLCEFGCIYVNDYVDALVETLPAETLAEFASFENVKKEFEILFKNIPAAPEDLQTFSKVFVSIIKNNLKLLESEDLTDEERMTIAKKLGIAFAGLFLAFIAY